MAERRVALGFKVRTGRAVVVALGGAHPLLHAAEGELYRDVFSDASAALGAVPLRVAEGALTASAGRALGLSPGKLAAQMAAMGKASGRPWAANQKQATLAAWLAYAAA